MMILLHCLLRSDAPCEDCNADAYNSGRLQTLPEVLCVNLRRTLFGPNGVYKDCKHVFIPESISLLEHLPADTVSRLESTEFALVFSALTGYLLFCSSWMTTSHALES
jgi:hypothetical protein